MTIKWKYNLTILAATLLPSFAYATTETLPSIGVGLYTLNDKITLPLLVTSKDQGANWSYAPDISSRSVLPADFTDSPPLSTSSNSFVSASCQHNFCMAAGRYRNNTGAFVPLVALSQNQGTSWHYTSLTPTDYVNDPQWIFDPIKTACNTKMCLVTMPYINTHHEWSYLVATTQDQGHSWSYPQSILAGLPKGDVMIASLNCTEQSCVGAGYVDSPNPNGYKRHGFITVSKDQAKTWTFPKLNLPDGYKAPVFEAVKCKENICLATGMDTGSYRLVLLRSTDGGDSWDIIPNNYHDIINESESDRIITYAGNTWAISGTQLVSQKDGHNNIYPFVLVSQDDGKTWTQPTDIISKLPDELARTNFTFGGLIDCSGNTCIMATSTMLANRLTPALAMSQDKGVSWSYININPPSSQQATLSHLSCKEKNCIILGDYVIHNSSKPFLLTSHNNGKTWYSPALTIPENEQATLYGGVNGSSFLKTKATTYRAARSQNQ